jgi:hypothetical protein
MKAQVGLYHVSRNMGSWNVYQYNHVTANSNSSTKIESFPHFEEAIREMYKLNGWNEPKLISKRN